MRADSIHEKIKLNEGIRVKEGASASVLFQLNCYMRTSTRMNTLESKYNALLLNDKCCMLDQCRITLKLCVPHLSVEL